MLCKFRQISVRDERGVTAIEFAMIAPIFLLLFFVIFETGLIIFSQAMLQNAVNDASRLIRTGQVQSGGMSQDQFRSAVCDGGVGLIACDDLTIDVRSFKQFSTASYQPPIDAQGNLLPGNANFVPGNPGDVVLVRALYPWVVMTPLLTPFLANMAGGKHLLVASAAFRNEKY